MVRYIINTTELNTANQKTKTSCWRHSEEHRLDIIVGKKKKMRSLGDTFARVILSVTMACRNCPRLSFPPGVARIDNMEMLAELAETMPHVETADDRSLT
jgi:hypothetical protein